MSPRARTMLRWSRRIILGLLALIALAIGGALIFVHTDYGREVIRGQVEAKLADTFVGGATVGKIDGSPFGELILHDVVINNPAGQRAITIERLAIEIALLPLARQEARLTSVVASGIDVDLQRDANGDLMVKRMLKPARTSGWSIELSHLEVHRANVAVEMPDGTIHLDGIEVLGAATIPAVGPVATTVGLRALWREKAAPISLDAVVRVDEGVISVPSLAASTGGIYVTGGGLRVALGAPGERPRIDGRITIDAPAREIARLVPELKLPADVSATITARDRDPWTELVVIGRAGKTSAQVLAGADLQAMRVRGVIASDSVDLPVLTRGEVAGTGGAVVAFDATYTNEQPLATGVVATWGQVQRIPALQATVAFHTDGTRLATTAAIAGRALVAGVDADLVRRGRTITLERSTVIASTADPGAASGGVAKLRGSLDVRLAASGQLVPAMSLALAGTVKGRRLRMQELSAKSLDVAIDATGLPHAPRGKAELVVDDLVRGDMELGLLKLTAANRPDGRIAVAVRSRPAFAPWLVDLDALITPPKPRMQTWIVDLERHRVRAGEDGNEWTGTTGHLELAPDSYKIENLASQSARGRFSLSASLAPGQLDVALTASRDKLGAARIDLDVAAPKQITNPAAWKQLTRAALRKAELELDDLQLAEVASLLGRPGEATGCVDGALALTPTAASGRLNLTGVQTKATERLGKLDAGLQITANADEIVPTLIGHMAGIGRFQATARIDLPARPLDLASWETRSMRGAELTVDEIAIEPGLLDRFGVTSELRGRVKLTAEIGEAMRSANVRVDLAQLRGDPIMRPIDTRIEAAIDDSLATAGIVVTSGSITLLDAKAELRLTIDELLADPSRLMTTPLKGLATIPDAPAATLLAVVGRTEVIGGTLGGKVTLGGTLAAPTVVAKLAGTNIQVPPGPRGRPVKVLEKLALDASYAGGVAKARIQGTQPSGYLDVAATANPKNLAAGTMTIKAKAFDLQPLLAFAPGPAGAGRGRLDADLSVAGLDPRTARLAGKLHLTNARIPIAPQIGTLRRATIDVVVGANTMKITADGRLGRGTVKLASSIVLAGAQPASGEATLTLRDVSPIGSVEPVVDADITARLRREPGRWIVDAVVSNGVVNVPSERGEALKPVGAPSDVVFATGEKLTQRPMTKAPPQRPALVVNVTINATHVESTELRGLIRGKVTLSADAEAVGITGSIEAYRGDLDLFGRRYQVERAAVRFDGSTDPLLDLRIAHDFPEVTTLTTVRGRLSKPELAMSSDPPIYSQSQLLGFLLGGEPNGDPQQGSAREVATTAGASFIANRLGGYVRRALPVDIDVIRYEAASATESAAVTVGTWLTRSWFLAYRRRVEARPDENANEAEIEYWISRRVMLEGSTGDRAVSGLDLLWRRRY